MVSAESHGLVNERVSHHRVVLGVLRDAQTSASQWHKSVQTLVCVIGLDEQSSEVHFPVLQNSRNQSMTGY